MTEVDTGVQVTMEWDEVPATGKPCFGRGRPISGKQYVCTFTIYARGEPADVDVMSDEPFCQSCHKDDQPKEETMKDLMGLTGTDVITGYCEYITGCHQVLLVPPGLDKDGKPYEARWKDIDRVTITRKKRVVLPTHKSDGADMAAPTREG